MLRLCLSFSIGLGCVFAQTAPSLAIPTFTGSFTTNGQTFSYTMVGQNPDSEASTTIPTVVVPVSLRFGAKGRMDAVPVVAKLLRSPVFQPVDFSNGKTQFIDALQRAQFGKATGSGWHTLLGRPTVARAIEIEIPSENGYLLHSRRTGRSLAVVDLDYLQKQLFANVSATPNALVIAVTRNVAFYSLGDATVCCSVGSHGVQVNAAGTATQAFVIGSYFDKGVMPRYTDIQGITQQLGEWFNDPLRGVATNEVPRWLKPPANVSCGGKGESSSYLLEQPADFLPAANAALVKGYHLENMALLSWFAQTPSGVYSFPDEKALASPAQPCALARAAVAPTGVPAERRAGLGKHLLIGYWEGYSSVRSPVALRDVSPQWDIIIATFATPVKGSTSLLQFAPPAAFGEERFKADVAYLQSQGKKVLISLGGGGQVVTLNTAEDLRNFVTSVTAIVEKYGFDGVDLDIETPSLLIESGDTDFRHPTTPAIVNLISAMRQMHEHFGRKFMIGEVPEAAQAQSGMQVYGGQFGSFLPVIYGTRDILSFVDAQDYNTPPLEGLDGNYYFPGNADYHVAMSEMLVHGFPVAGNVKDVFPPLPPEQVAIGLPATPSSARNYTEIPAIEDALRYLIDGKPSAGATYKLRDPAAYPAFLGAMFWAINEDRRNEYRMSNAIGRFLHEQR